MIFHLPGVQSTTIISLGVMVSYCFCTCLVCWPDSVLSTSTPDSSLEIYLNGILLFKKIIQEIVLAIQISIETFSFSLADLRSQPVQLGRSRAMVHQMRKSCRRGVPEKSRAEGSGKSNLPDLRRLLARLTVCRARPSLVSVGIGTGVGKD